MLKIFVGRALSGVAPPNDAERLRLMTGEQFAFSSQCTANQNLGGQVESHGTERICFEKAG
jgi:hypothetical protein